jgi:hypothetical protein
MGFLRRILDKLRRGGDAADSDAIREAERLKEAMDTQRAASQQDSTRFTGGFPG